MNPTPAPPARPALALLMVLGVLGFVAAAAGCGDHLPDSFDDPRADATDTAPIDAVDTALDLAPTTDLTHVLAQWEDGRIDTDALIAAVEALGLPELAAAPALTQEAVLSTTLALDAGMVIERDGILVLLPGATLQLPAGAELTVHGRLYALGREDAPTALLGAADARYATIRLLAGPNALLHTNLEEGVDLLTVENTGAARTLVDRCRFERWDEKAIAFDAADGLHIRDSEFGLTPASLSSGEAMRGFGSAARIEGCVFGKRTGYRDVLDLEECMPPHVPVIVRNRFLGGEDDAIDLDGCTAIVVNNHISDFWPPLPQAPQQGINGGGITGARFSTPVLVGNVIERCFHGIGFKDGVEPVLLHNTVIGSHIGLTFYHSRPGKESPHGVLVNNIFWNNRAWDTDQPQDIVLNGFWWPNYDQETPVQGSVEAHHNIFTTPVEGEGNLATDPLLEVDEDGLPVPGPDSPALGLATGDLETLPALGWSEVAPWLLTDRRGTTRPHTGDAPLYHFHGADLGALERP